jgi:HAD superfamily hydrolase (TIGR01450 family)
MVESLSNQELLILDLLKKIKVVIFDMDGVLRIGNNIVDGAQNIIPNLKKKLNIDSVILTNECRYTNKYLSRNLESLGVNLDKKTIIYTASNNVHNFLEKKLTKSKEIIEVVCVGEEGLLYNVNKLDTYDNLIIHDLKEEEPTINEDSTFYLIIGSVNKITIKLLQNIIKWTKFNPNVITTCEDNSDPSSNDAFTLGLPKQLLDMLKFNVTIDHYSLGKPNPLIKSNIMKKIESKINKKIKPQEILFIGDTIYTDIKLAFESDFHSLLVLSGNTKSKDLKNSIITPEFILDSVKDLERTINF